MNTPTLEEPDMLVYPSTPKPSTTLVQSRHTEMSIEEIKMFLLSSTQKQNNFYMAQVR